MAIGRACCGAWLLATGAVLVIAIGAGVAATRGGNAPQLRNAVCGIRQLTLGRALITEGTGKHGYTFRLSSDADATCDFKLEALHHGKFGSPAPIDSPAGGFQIGAHGVLDVGVTVVGKDFCPKDVIASRRSVDELGVVMSEGELAKRLPHALNPTCGYQLFGRDR